MGGLMFYFCILFSKEKGKSKEKQQKIKHSSVEQKLFRSAKEYRFPVDMKKSSFQSSSYIDVCVCVCTFGSKSPMHRIKEELWGKRKTKTLKENKVNEGKRKRT